MRQRRALRRAMVDPTMSVTAKTRSPTSVHGPDSGSKPETNHPAKTTATVIDVPAQMTGRVARCPLCQPAGSARGPVAPKPAHDAGVRIPFAQRCMEIAVATDTAIAVRPMSAQTFMAEASLPFVRRLH